MRRVGQLVHRRHVAGAQPAVGGELLRADRHLVVATSDVGPADLHLARRLAVVRHRQAVVAADAHVDQRHRRAGHRGAAEGLVLAGVAKLGPRVGHGRQRRGLGHAPALTQGDSMAREGADQCLGHGRSADQRTHAGRHLPAAGLRALRGLEGLDQAHPDGRHAQRQRRRLQLHQVEQVVGVQVRAGEDDLGAHHHRAIGHAPAVGMEHRRHRQQAVGALQVPHVAQAADQACAARSSGANRPRPWAGRWCPRCSTSRSGHARRAARTGSRPGRRRPATARSRRTPRVPARRRTETRSPCRRHAGARTACTAAAGCRRRSGSGPGRRRRSSRSRPAPGAGSACASRRRLPGCRNRLPGAHGGSRPAWPRVRPFAVPVAAAPRPARACDGSTRRRCAGAASCRAAAR